MTYNSSVSPSSSPQFQSQSRSSFPSAQIAVPIPSPSGSPSDSPSSSPLRSRKLSEKARNLFSKKEKLSSTSSSPKPCLSSISPPLHPLPPTPVPIPNLPQHVLPPPSQNELTGKEKEEQESKLESELEREMLKAGLTYQPRRPKPSSASDGITITPTDQSQSQTTGVGLQSDSEGLQPSAITVSIKKNPGVESRLQALMASNSRIASAASLVSNVGSGSASSNDGEDEEELGARSLTDKRNSASLPKIQVGERFTSKDGDLNTPVGNGAQLLTPLVSNTDSSTTPTNTNYHHHHHLPIPTLISAQSKLRKLVHSRTSSGNSSNALSIPSMNNSNQVENKLPNPVTIISTSQGPIPLVGALPVVSSTSSGLSTSSKTGGQNREAQFSEDRGLNELSEVDETELDNSKADVEGGDGNGSIIEADETDEEDLVKESSLLGFSNLGPNFKSSNSKVQDLEYPASSFCDEKFQDGSEMKGKGEEVEEEDEPQPLKQQRPSIKVRIVTWNMASTVPKGDLEVLLGRVGDYKPPAKDWDVGYDSEEGEDESREDEAKESENRDPSAQNQDSTSTSPSVSQDQFTASKSKPKKSPSGPTSTLKGSAVIGQESIPRADRIPPLPHDDLHPYHVLVIAGQECPWGDGKRIATGMGMAGEIGDIALNRSRSNAVKSKEKEKEKEKEKGIGMGLKKGISSSNLKKDGGVLTPADPKSPMGLSSQSIPWINEFPFGSPPPIASSNQHATFSDQVPQTPSSASQVFGKNSIPEDGGEKGEKGRGGFDMKVSGKGWSDMCEDWLCNGPFAASCATRGLAAINSGKPQGGLSRTSTSTTATTTTAAAPSNTNDITSPQSSNPNMMRSPSNGPSRITSNEVSRTNSPAPALQMTEEKEKNKMDLPKLRLRLEGLQTPIRKKEKGISTPTIQTPTIETINNGSPALISVPGRSNTSLDLSRPEPRNGTSISSTSENGGNSLLSVPSNQLSSSQLGRSNSNLSDSSNLPPLSPGSISPMTEDPNNSNLLQPTQHHPRLNLNPVTSTGKEHAPNEWGRIRSPSPSFFPPQPETTTNEYDEKEDATPQTLGPYELVIKERMLGCYTAVYVWRGCRDRVKGASRGHVKSGLLSGRVGNKGGIGISLLLGRSRLLFVNAHLAAHEGRVATRLANVVKIKSELDVDTFLPPGDPRNNYEDVTEKFDHCFWCGDLNFRVDISRKHADWLLMQKAYQQALEFDQLRAVLKDGIAFKGFQEAPITFPPTYKYDVLKTLKIKRTRTVTQRIIHRRTGSSSKATGSAFSGPQSEEKSPGSRALSSSLESKPQLVGEKRNKREKGGKSKTGRVRNPNDTSASVTDEDSDSSVAWDPFSNSGFGEHREGDSDSDEDSGPAAFRGGGKRNSHGSGRIAARSGGGSDGGLADSVLESNTAAAQGAKVFSQSAAIKAKFKLLDLMRSVGNKDSDSNLSSPSSSSKKAPHAVRKDSGKESILSSDSSNPKSPSTPIDIPTSGADGQQNFACLENAISPSEIGISASRSENALQESRSARSSISEDQEGGNLNNSSPSSKNVNRSSLPPPPKTYSGPGVKKRSAIRRPSSSDGLSLASSLQSGVPAKVERSNSKASAGSAGSGWLVEAVPAEEKQAYDTSAKQRVPSWCDRVLWRSTVPIEEDEEANPQDAEDQGFGSKVSRGISQALMIPQIRQASQRREAARQAAVTFALPASVAEREKEKERREEKIQAQSQSSNEKVDEFGTSISPRSSFSKAVPASKHSLDLPSNVSIAPSTSSSAFSHASPLRRFFRRRGDPKSREDLGPHQQKKKSKADSRSDSPPVEFGKSGNSKSNGLESLSRIGALSAVDLPSQSRMEEKREIKEMSDRFVVPPRRESLQLPIERERKRSSTDEGKLPIPILGSPKDEVPNHSPMLPSSPAGQRKSMFRSVSSSGIANSSPESSTLAMNLESETSPTDVSNISSNPVSNSDLNANIDETSTKDSLNPNGTGTGVGGTGRRASSWWSDRVVMRLPSILSPAKAAGVFASLGIFSGENKEEEKAAEPELVGPKRGVIECMLYKTLDDREMRILEGRSDHRPVIFVAAIGI